MAKGQSQQPGRDVRGGTGKRQRPYDGSKSAGYKGKGDGRPGGRDGRPGSRDGRPGGRDSRPGNRDGRPGGRDGRSGGRDNRYGSRDNRSGGYNGYRKGPGGPGGRDGRPDKRRTSSSLIEGRRAAAEALDVHVPIKRALVAKSGGDRSLDRWRLFLWCMTWEDYLSNKLSIASYIE